MTNPDDSNLEFSQLARLGRTSWKRYLAAVLTIASVWLGVGTAAQLGVLTVPGAFEPSSSAGFAASPLGFVAENTASIFLLVGVLIAVRFIHRRPTRTVFTANPRLRPGRIAASFAFYILLASVAAFIWALLHPTEVSFSFEPRKWIAVLPLVLVFTGLQVTAEEALFRGYLLQAVGLLARRTWLLVLVGAALFALPHLGNPEFATGPILVYAFYFGLGSFLTFLAIRENGLELALGAHAANNLFTALIENHEHSTVATNSLWQVAHFDPAYDLAAFVVGAVIFCLVLARKRS